MIKEDDLQVFRLVSHPPSWAQTDSNRRPSACKADALNQLSYAPFAVTFRFGDARVLFFLDSANFFPFNPFPAPWEQGGTRRACSPGQRRSMQGRPLRAGQSRQCLQSRTAKEHAGPSAPGRAVPAVPAVPCRALQAGKVYAGLSVVSLMTRVLPVSSRSRITGWQNPELG